MGLITWPPWYADCLETWEPQTPGTLRDCPGLNSNCFAWPWYVNVYYLHPQTTDCGWHESLPLYNSQSCLHAIIFSEYPKDGGIKLIVHVVPICHPTQCLIPNDSNLWSFVSYVHRNAKCFHVNFNKTSKHKI
jgi:hypothetical protein